MRRGRRHFLPKLLYDRSVHMCTHTDVRSHVHTAHTPHSGLEGAPAGWLPVPQPRRRALGQVSGKEASLRQGTELGVFVTSARTSWVSHRTRCGRGSRPLPLPDLGGLGWSPCDLVCRPPDDGQHCFWERIPDTVQLVSLAPWGRGWLARPTSPGPAFSVSVAGTCTCTVLVEKGTLFGSSARGAWVRDRLVSAKRGTAVLCHRCPPGRVLSVSPGRRRAGRPSSDILRSTGGVPGQWLLNFRTKRIKHVLQVE